MRGGLHTRIPPRRSPKYLVNELGAILTHANGAHAGSTGGCTSSNLLADSSSSSYCSLRGPPGKCRGE